MRRMVGYIMIIQWQNRPEFVDPVKNMGGFYFAQGGNNTKGDEVRNRAV